MSPALLALLAGLAATPAGPPPPVAGDTLSCGPDGRVVVVIGSFDQLDGTAVAGISLFDQIPGSPLAVVDHLPVEMSALLASCPGRLARRPRSDGFEGGYAVWREAYDAGEGGYFTIPVDQILDILLKSLPREGGDQ